MMKLIFLFAFLILVGCGHPTGRPQHKQTGVRLEDFSGVYTNRAGPWELASAITPYKSGAWSADIVQVKVEGSAVEIQALRAGKVIYAHTFEEGKDFHLRNSQITAQSKAYGRVVHANEGFILPAIPGPQGTVFSGTFFLNANRDLIYRRSNQDFQLSFYFLPTAGGAKEDVVFKRLQDTTAVAPGN